MNGHTEELDPDQKAMLEQVRDGLTEILKEEHDDRFLLRFLRARSFHGEDTKEMLRSHLRWREHFSSDYLVKEYKVPEFLDKYIRTAVLGFANDGSLVRILRLGYSDLKGVLLANTSLEIEKFFAYILTVDGYQMKLRREETGYSSEKSIFIGDFEDVNVYDFPVKYTLSILIRLVKVFEANFPEYLNAVHLVNCPTVMYYVLKALKPFMSEVTASKVKIYGTEGYQDVLLKDIDPEVLPIFLGGSRYDTDDEKAVTLLNIKTAKIPENSYYFHARKLSATDPGVTQVTVERRNSFTVDVEVPENNYAVMWEVDIQDYDLGVGLFFRTDSDSDEELKCVKEVKRLKSQYSPYMGMHICDKPGTYVFMLDNGYSYFTDKVALYKIEVKPPPNRKE